MPKDKSDHSMTHIVQSIFTPDSHTNNLAESNIIRGGMGTRRLHDSGQVLQNQALPGPGRVLL